MSSLDNNNLVLSSFEGFLRDNAQPDGSGCSEFRLVIANLKQNDLIGFYCHPLNRDGQTFDGEVGGNTIYLKDPKKIAEHIMNSAPKELKNILAPEVEIEELPESKILGRHFLTIAAMALQIAFERDVHVHFKFNGTDVIINKESNIALMYRNYLICGVPTTIAL